MAKAKKRKTQSKAKAKAKPKPRAPKSVKQPALAPFTGFPKDAPAFWHELASEMNKEWFDANKQRYESQWVEPMTRLLAGVSAKLAKAYKPFVLGPPKIMRIYRDTRFSKDKAPYKTHIGAVITVGGKALAQAGNAALYMHMGADEEFVGVGCYFFEPDKLPKWRKQVAGKAGESLAKLVDKLRDAGYAVGGHDDLKKVPKPYDAEHPRGEFLKMKGLTGGLPEIPRGLIFKPELVDWLAEHAAAMAPMVSWIQKHVG
jgi:uncharacterized protein (TIGR02453 family)